MWQPVVIYSNSTALKFLDPQINRKNMNRNFEEDSSYNSRKNSTQLQCVKGL